jgi:hypothetical protein
MNEISASLSVSVSQGGNSASGSVSFHADAQADGFTGSEQLAGTTAAALDFGDLALPQMLFVKNLDSANFVQIDANSSFNGFPQKILPGQGVFLAPKTGTIYAKADTAPVLLWVVVA